MARPPPTPLLAPRDGKSQTTPPPHAPLYALVIPCVFFLLLGMCVLIRALVRRRQDRLGPHATASWPWSWLGVCVDSRRGPRAHSWEISVSSPAGMPHAMRRATTQPHPQPPQVPPAAVTQSIRRPQVRQHHPMWESVGRRPSATATLSSSSASASTAVREKPPPPLARPEPARLRGEDEPDRATKSVCRNSTRSGDSMASLGRTLAGPPVLQLPPEFGRSESSSWELDTKKLFAGT